MTTTKQLIARLGINEAHAVSLLRRRQRAALLRDRTKIFATTPVGNIPHSFFYPNRYDAAVDLGALIHAGNTGNTKLYVTAWCRLNHLKA
jgi:hypothetical protein